MVVPYIKPIEKAPDSKVDSLDSEMSAIINNPRLESNEKVRLYNQALAKFQTYYNPDTYRQINTSTDVASEVKSILDEKLKSEPKPEPVFDDKKYNYEDIKNAIYDISQTQNKQVEKNDIQHVNKQIQNLRQMVKKIRENNKKAIISKRRNVITDENEEEIQPELNDELYHSTIESPVVQKPKPSQSLRNKVIEKYHQSNLILDTKRLSKPAPKFDINSGKFGSGLWFTKKFF